MIKGVVRWYGSCVIAHYFTANEIIIYDTYINKNLLDMKINNGGSNLRNETWLF